MVYDRMADYVRALGQVHLKRPLKYVIQENENVSGLELKDGRSEPFDHVISTMPLTALVRRLENVPEQVLNAAQSLNFRNTILVYLHVDGTDLFPNQWVYVHAPELHVGHITNFRNWVPDLSGNDISFILSLEYWYYDHDPMWNETDEQLIDRVNHEIRSTGLIGDSPIADGHVERIRKCYPVYAKNYKFHLTAIEKYVSTIGNLTPIGRYGAFKYNNQDHSSLAGLLAAENLSQQHDNALWSINTDYEDYQEAAIITATKLEPVLAY